MNARIKYSFVSELWKHKTEGGWYFVSVPIEISKEIRMNLKWQEEGWGRMKATAVIGPVEWESAIWFDSKLDTYVLPIKAEIRKKLKLSTKKEIRLSILI